MAAPRWYDREVFACLVAAAGAVLDTRLCAIVLFQHIGRNPFDGTFIGSTSPSLLILALIMAIEFLRDRVFRGNKIERGSTWNSLTAVFCVLLWITTGFGLVLRNPAYMHAGFTEMLLDALLSSAASFVAGAATVVGLAAGDCRAASSSSSPHDSR